MQLCTEVGLGPADIVLDGDPATPRKLAQQPPTYQKHSLYRMTREPTYKWQSNSKYICKKTAVYTQFAATDQIPQKSEKGTIDHTNIDIQATLVYMVNSAFF